MTKRGIDDLSFNGSSSTAVATGVGTGSAIISAQMPVKIENDSSDASNNATADGRNDSFNVANGTSSSDYINGGTNGPIINGGNSNSVHEDHSGNKKFKSDASTVAASAKSRVVHIRNIPADTSTTELLMFAQPFGTVTKHLFVRSKGQAFVEFDSHFSALNMASFWIQTTIGGMPTQVQPTIRNRHVHVQLSNHKELKTQFENNNNNLNAVNSSSNGFSNNNNNPSVSSLNSNVELTTPSEVHADGETQHTSAGTSSTPSPVIRVLIENPIYPVTLDGLYQVFSRFGKVLKIVTFQQFQALIQFGDIASSIQAKTNYDGQSIYAGATSAGLNVMRIEYSKLQNLTVKYNNDKSRDYTTILNQNGSLNGTLSSSNNHLNHHGLNLSESTDMSHSLLNQSLVRAATAAALSAAGFPNPSIHPLAGSAAMNLNGHHNSVSDFNAAGFNSRYLSTASIQQALSAGGLATGSLMNPANAAMFAAGIPTNLVFTSVIHVSGLNPEHITPDALFTLFGVYGDVIRVKILFNKKDTALIQMAEPQQAQNAISYLDRTKLFGKVIHVMSSKHQIVQMPKEKHQESGLTKDYTNSPLHRFKRPGSKNYNNIYPPSETLHVSNIPSTCTEQDLRQAFQQETGKEISKFKFFPNDHRMALVQFDSIEDAIIALIKMHNYKVAEHSHLRVSFSKSPV